MAGYSRAWAAITSEVAVAPFNPLHQRSKSTTASNGSNGEVNLEGQVGTGTGPVFAGGVLLTAAVGGALGVFDRGPTLLDVSDARERGREEARPRSRGQGSGRRRGS